MASDTPLFEPSKVDPPRLRRAVSRARLIARLAEHADTATWVQAPTGCGKSVLAHQYAQARAAPLLWYRFDERDNDPAFFFSALGTALRAGVATAASLPRFSDAHYDLIDDFARRWMRAVATALPGAVQFVFDDAYAVSSTATLAALARLMDLASPACGFLLLAETAPPAALFEAIAAGRLTVRDDIDLRFTADDCLALAAARGSTHLDGAHLAALTGGHAGAVVLACELLRGAKTELAGASDATAQVHRLLLAGLLDRLPATQIELVWPASILPQVTAALAAELLGRHPDAATIDLQELTERGLLQRIDTAEGIAYELEGLVRRGARALYEQRFGLEQMRQLAARAATRLPPEQAVDVLLATRQFEAAADLMPALAQQCARERRPAYLQGLLAQLPPALIDARPGLVFWAGHALLGVDGAAARGWFERAFRAFEAQADRAGMAVAAASVLVATTLDYVDPEQSDTWRARFGQLKGAIDDQPGALRNICLLGLLADAIMAAADDADLDAAGRALSELRSRVLRADEWTSLDQRVDAARVMVEHAQLLQTKQLALQIAADTRPLAEDPATGPLPAGRWLVALAQVQRMSGDAAAADSTLRHADAIAQAAAYPPLQFEVGVQRVILALAGNRDDEARALLATLEAHAGFAKPFQRAYLGHLGARLLLRQGRATEAVQRAQAALDLARSGARSPAHTRLFEMQVVLALTAQGDLAGAAEHAQALAASLVGAQRTAVDAIAASIDFLRAHESDFSALRRAWTLIEERTFLSIFQDTPRLAARLCAAALRHGVGEPIVRRMIEQRKLAPPPDAGPQWPWPVRVFAFNGFRLEIDGAPYAPEHKAADKPLELLKALLAAQAIGRPAAAKEWLAERLWPDADEGNARKSLDMTLARLRKLLGRDNAIDVAEGRLRLNPAVVWTDLNEFSDATADLNAASAGRLRPAGVDRNRLTLALGRLAGAYRGPFLAGERDAPWLLMARAQLARNFRLALMDAETLLPQTDDPGAAIAALERALQAEPAAEDLARALMRAHERQGDPAAALAVYSRTRASLAQTLGIAPSAQTEALREHMLQLVQARVV